MRCSLKVAGAQSQRAVSAALTRWTSALHASPADDTVALRAMTRQTVTWHWPTLLAGSVASCHGVGQRGAPRRAFEFLETRDPRARRALPQALDPQSHALSVLAVQCLREQWSPSVPVAGVTPPSSGAALTRTRSCCSTAKSGQPRAALVQRGVTSTASCTPFEAVRRGVRQRLAAAARVRPELPAVSIAVRAVAVQERRCAQQVARSTNVQSRVQPHMAQGGVQNWCRDCAQASPPPGASTHAKCPDLTQLLRPRRHRGRS